MTSKLLSAPVILAFARGENNPAEFQRRWAGKAVAEFAAGDSVIEARILRAQVRLDERNAVTRDLLQEATWNIEIRGKSGSDFYAVETRRRGAAALGERLADLWHRDPEVLAVAQGYHVSYRTRDELAAQAKGRRIIGLVLLESRRILVASDLSEHEARGVVAHELAHAFLLSACDGSTGGEAAASAFADAFVG